MEVEVERRADEREEQWQRVLAKADEFEIRLGATISGHEDYVEAVVDHSGRFPVKDVQFDLTYRPEGGDPRSAPDGLRGPGTGLWAAASV